MIRKPISFPGNVPLTRAVAAEVVQTASAFEARVMIQRDQKIVNAKSMLGLLSLGADDQANMVLIAEGADEAAAADAVMKVLGCSVCIAVRERLVCHIIKERVPRVLGRALLHIERTARIICDVGCKICLKLLAACGMMYMSNQ